MSTQTVLQQHEYTVDFALHSFTSIHSDGEQRGFSCEHTALRNIQDAIQYF